MINILKTGNAIVIDFTDNDKYLHNGTIEVAPNELMIVIDESNMATFKKMSNGDTLFGLLIDLIQIQGENVTKDNIIEKFGAIGFSISEAVSSVNGQTGDVVITAAGLGAITKADADAAYASKTELASKADTSTVEALNGEIDNKLDTLVSGTNIKTINGESVLGTGDLTISGGSEPRTWEVHIDSELTSDWELNPTPVGWSIYELEPAFGDIIKFTGPSEIYELVVTGKGFNYYLLSSISSISFGGYLFAIGVRLDKLQIFRTIPVTRDDSRVLIGYRATGTGDFGITIGRNSSNTTGVAIGVKANSGDDAIAIGNNVTASEARSINIGNKIKVNSAGFSYTGKNGEVNLDDALVKDTEMSDTSENAVQNKVIKAYIDSLVGNILTQLQEINGTN